MPWDLRIERVLDRYPALKAIGNTPLVPVALLRADLPDVEVLAKLEFLNPGGSLKDRPVVRMVLSALDDGRLAPGKTIRQKGHRQSRGGRHVGPGNPARKDRNHL
jgi:hypothetical protein